MRSFSHEIPEGDQKNPFNNKTDKNISNRKDRSEEKFFELHSRLKLVTQQLKYEEDKHLRLRAFKSTLYDFLKVFRVNNEAIIYHRSNESHELLKSEIFKTLGYEDVFSSKKEEALPSKNIKMDRILHKKDFQPHPIIFDNPKEVFVIMNIGRPPTFEQKEFYNKNFIYPINYRIERIYKNYQNNTNSLLIYTCAIKNKDNKILFEIYDNDKLLCSGNRNCWKTFKELTHMNHPNIQLEDFFALSNKKVIHIIESKTDMRSLRGYIPLDYRQGL